MCENSNMIFYTNPYLDIAKVNDPDFVHNEIVVNMICEVFPLIDEVSKEPLYAIHNYISKESQIDGEGEHQDTFYINKTDFNRQYFEITFEKKLEYVEIQKSLMYVTKYGEVEETILNEDDFKSLRFSKNTIKLLEIAPQEISNTVAKEIVLLTEPG